MKKKHSIVISVRSLVEFILRSGDITSLGFHSSRAVEGTKAHQKIQKKAPKNYQAEVVIQFTQDYGNFELVLNGRIDGVIHETVKVIDEIKSTVKDVAFIKENDHPVHWAQAEIYAYMYACAHNLEMIDVQLTYVQVHGEGIKQFKRRYTSKEIEERALEIIHRYGQWAELFYQWEIKKYQSIKALKFPFQTFRKGQKKLLKSVYRTIMEEQKLFLRAPTGIGKTIGTLFPAIKVLEEKRDLKQLFYLTAKTIGREVAEETLKLLQDNGLCFKSTTITAKDKICFLEERICDSESCPYAKGHYDRVNEAILQIYKAHQLINKKVIEDYGKRYQVCPFELQLDIAYFSDGIICDYNYAFDPRVMLKRFFLDNNHYIFLVDEAHNLPDRAREMYSSTFMKQDILRVRKKVKGLDKPLYNYLGKINQALLEVKKEHLDEGNLWVEEALPQTIVDLSRGILHRFEKLFEKNQHLEERENLLEFYFLMYDFVKKSEFYDQHFCTYFEKVDGDVKIKLFCLDPSYVLQQCFKNAKASIVFSATLLPLTYYIQLLGGTKENYGLLLDSPFKKENLCMLVQDSISTKYKDRENTYHQVAETIYEAIQVKKGNYLVFFPSYAYLKAIKEQLLTLIGDEAIVLLEQTWNMDEEEKKAYLETFKKDGTRTLMGLAVLGGVFGEGIDLVGERLEGVIIVGVGLPGINLENDLIKDYYKSDYQGYQYAYMFPGMNKVMQAIGRVIRTETDKGMVLLIDKRYEQHNYQRIFPDEWSHRLYVGNTETIKKILSNFWKVKK